MKAAVFYGKHNLKTEEISMPEPKADEVIIKVMACGICGTDIHIRRQPMKDTLFAIGEALIDFIPSESGCGFSEVSSFSPKIGGAPANTALAFVSLDKN